ncbi:FprA family A-type flavoprotein [Clostridium cadaveris]|uniref:FprA family A-type flavoprotein n=1 Tax=Clostridium cadaveris TaxID=1529 RepID=UPI000C082A7E|nr:FprA family A-type flavoprotein [Clostridium cadaveris]
MKSVEVKKDIFWVGALDPGLRVFDIIMYTPYGTSYNSYVVQGSEKIAIFETVKEEFFDQYIERLNSLNINISDIDYIVVDHTEPDHVGSVSKILDLAPNAKVVGSNCAIQYLNHIINKPFEHIVAKDGTSLSLGNKTLKFISAPFLHWPDSMYTYIPEDSLLITCDSFGSHYSEENMFNDLVKNEKDYMDALKYYYDCIFGPFKPYVLKAIDKIKDLSIDTVCPGHGPILRENPWKIINIYKEWSTPSPIPSIPNITISYVSAYGYTKQLAEEIAKGISSKGDFEIKLFDLVSSSQDEILESINKSDGILFGSPTINCDLLEPIRDLMTKLNPVVHGKRVAGAFGSYGWSGEAVPNMENRLKELRMDLLLPSLKIKFKPSSEELTSAFNFGELFADKVLAKRHK